MRTALLIAALAAVSSPAGASTLRLYTPGGAPCAGLCSYEWAVERFQVPTGTPERMMIPKGSLVLQMSYARDGKPWTPWEPPCCVVVPPGPPTPPAAPLPASWVLLVGALGLLAFLRRPRAA